MQKLTLKPIFHLLQGDAQLSRIQLIISACHFFVAACHSIVAGVSPDCRL